MQECISEERFRELVGKAFPGPSRIVSVSVLHWSASVLVKNEYPIGLDELEYLAGALGITRDQVKLFTKGLCQIEIHIDLDPETPIQRPPITEGTRRLTMPKP